MRERKDIERGALASLITAAQMDTVKANAALDTSRATPDDVTDPDLRDLFARVEAAVRENRNPEFFATTSGLSDRAKSIASELWVDTESVEAASPRLAALRERGNARRLLASIQRISDGVKAGKTPTRDALEQLQTTVDVFSGTVDRKRSLLSDGSRLLDDMAKIEDRVVEPAIPTGIESLDMATGGLQRTLTIIGALPGVGKSAVLASIVRNMTAQGRKVGFFSLEDEASWLTNRLTADAAKVSLFALTSKPLYDAQRDRVARAWGGIMDTLGRIIVDDTPLMTVDQIVASARSMVVNDGVEAIMIDHLGEIKLARTDRHDLDVIEVLQQLRLLSKRYKIPVVIAAHLKRRQGLDLNTRPELTDFAFSSGLERMARVALGLSRGPEGSREINITVLKQTNGPAGMSFPVSFIGAVGTVDNAHIPNESLSEMLAGAKSFDERNQRGGNE